MKKVHTHMHERVALIALIVVVIAGAAYFRSGMTRASLLESEMAFVSQVDGTTASGPRLPHLEYQSPAYRAVLEAVGTRPSEVLGARTLSWIVTVGTLAAIMAAAWTLFSPLEAIAAGGIAVGSLRLLQAAHTAGPDAFLMFWLSITAALMGMAFRSSSWWVWIGMGVTSIIAALSGFQAAPLLISVAALGGVLVSQHTRRDGAEVSPPIWQYVSSVPVALAVSALWSVTWVLSSREANPPIARPPLMNPRYLLFVHSYLLGHAPWAVRILGAAAIVGIVGSVKKRIVRIENLRRVYVDKRSRRPMFFLLLWLAVGVPMLNLLLFNARRPQDPMVINSLLIPLTIVAARGLVLCSEGIVVGMRRVAGVRAPLWMVVVVVGLGMGWFTQGAARTAYDGYRLSPQGEDPWAQASSFLSPRRVLGQSALLTPPWAGRLVSAQFGSALQDVDTVVPVLGSQVDSLVRAAPACWAIVYQSDIYPPVPDRIRRSLDQHFEEIRSFVTGWGGNIIILATPWLQASETQWSIEQERLAMGGDEADQGRLVMARLYLAAGRGDLARAALEQVLTHDPRNAQAFIELAVLAEREGEKDNAVVWYRRAAQADSTDPRPYYEQGRLLYELGRFAASQQRLEEAIRLDSGHVQAAQLLVHVYRELGDDEKAATMDERLEDLGGKFMVDYEFGRQIAVRSVDVPTFAWHPDDEVAVVLTWSTLAASASPFYPRLVVHSASSPAMLKPPPGGWSLSLPDSGFPAALAGNDTLNLHVFYREPPLAYPDEIELRLEMVDSLDMPLAVSTSRGEQLEAAPIARLVASRVSGQRRVTVEAEEMDQHPGFAVPGGINITDAGVAHSFRFPGGPVTFEIVARGTPAAGQWPRLVLEVGGQLVRELDVPDREWRTYRVSVSEAAGERAVRIRFPNDYVNRTTGEDRNLVIDQVTMVEEEILFRVEAP